MCDLSVRGDHCRKAVAAHVAQTENGDDALNVLHKGIAAYGGAPTAARSPITIVR